jgi:ribosomal protein S27E
VNEIFEIEYSLNGVMSRYPAYSCGHCTATVILNPERARERVTCKKCGRWLCETNELCRVDCTPIYDLAKDKAWMDGSKWNKLVTPIMGGARSINEAHELGLLKE